MSERIDPNLERYLKIGAETPNAPFIFKPAKRLVERELFALGFEPFVPDNEKEARLELASDEYAIYARIRYGNPGRKIIVTTHLDHPYLVLDGRSGGVPLGTIGNTRLNRLANKEGIPINIFSKDGEYIGADTVVDATVVHGRPRIKTRGLVNHPTNAQGVWNLDPIIFNEGKIAMINSDNATSTALIFAVIRNLVLNSSVDNLNVEFVFNYLEEIRQISATGMSLRGGTPFAKIDKDDLILVLESASSQTPEEFKFALTELGLSVANYTDGPIIRVNDYELVHGQKREGENLTENLLINTADKLGVKYQQTLVGGTCDATAYTLFLNTASIASLTIPTIFKHNNGNGGEFVREEIQEADVISAANIVLNAITASSDTIEEHPKSVSHKLKRTSVAATKVEFDALKKDRVSAYRGNIQRLKAGKNFPENINEVTRFFYGSSLGAIKKRI